MKIKGEVTSGFGKAAFFYHKNFILKTLKNCGFVPYPGTLNVIVPDKYLSQINEIKTLVKHY